MANPTACSVCVKSKEEGIPVDTTHSKTYWAEVFDVSEASVRRHFKHGPEPRLGASEVSDTETESEGAEYKETWKGDEGEITVVLNENISNEAILRKFGHDPEQVSIVGVLEETHWQMAGQWQHRYRFKTSRKSSDDLTVEDLPLLYSEVMSREPVREEFAQKQGRSLVVVWADIQVGKTGSRGGTPELIERVKEKRAKLQDYIEKYPADHAYFLSVGDEVESFENTAQQPFTNDLSFPDQLDLELTFELDMITDLADMHDSVTVAGCSSNHCRWRQGKGVLGLPKDDYGLYLKRQLEKAMRLNDKFSHVTFEYPEPWDETMAVDVQGTKIGLAHGHQATNPNGIEAWWVKQAFGAQAVADADILLTGHFHTYRGQQMGRSAKTGRSRWWLQAPTLDNGSDWYRNAQGSDSDAGMLVFCVDENGFDLQSLDIL